MKSNQLPSVLLLPKGNSISMERALKQIRDLLHLVDTPNEGLLDDMVNISIDDVETMLAAINRD